MIAYETFTCEGGPLNGDRIEIAHEDVMHPSTAAIRIFCHDNESGRYVYEGFVENKGRVMRWQQS